MTFHGPGGEYVLTWSYLDIQLTILHYVAVATRPLGDLPPPQLAVSRMTRNFSAGERKSIMARQFSSPKDARPSIKLCWFVDRIVFSMNARRWYLQLCKDVHLRGTGSRSGGSQVSMRQCDTSSRATHLPEVSQYILWVVFDKNGPLAETSHGYCHGLGTSDTGWRSTAHLFDVSGLSSL